MKRKLPTLLLVAALFTLTGITCLISFHIIGGYLDENNVLHEPFALLPLGYLSLFIGGILGTIVLAKKVMAK